MAEETVVKEPLTTEMVAAGEELTRRLDALGFEVVSSLWLYSTEANQWRLVLASPQVASEGPKKTYAKVLAALSGEPEQVPGLNSENVTVLSPDNPLVRLFRSAVRTGKGISGIRFSRNRIKDRKSVV